MVILLSLSDCLLLDGDEVTLDLGWLLRFLCFKSSSILSGRGIRVGSLICSNSSAGFSLSPGKSADTSDISSNVSS